MKNSKNRVLLLVPCILVLICALVVSILVIKSPKFYCKRCLYSNKSDFENVVKYVKQYGITEDMKLDDSDIPQEIKEILERLNQKYQKDSDYPIFKTLDVRADADENVYISLQVEKHKIKNADGYDTPDIRCYYLIYVDPDYAGNNMIKTERPFYGNWRIWSQDLWSG